MKKIWLLLIVIALGGCKMSSDTNEETDDGLYDYELTTSIENNAYRNYNFYYGTDINSKNFVVIEARSTYKFKRNIKVKDDENGIPIIEEDTAPDCILESLSFDDSEYRIIKFNYKNIRQVIINETGVIQLIPMLV